MTQRRNERDDATNLLLEPPEEAVLRDAFDVGMTIHRKLGPGLFESAYEEIFCHEMKLRGHTIARQVDRPIEWNGLTLEKAYRLDVLVDDLVVIEIKAVAAMNKIFERQLQTYLKLSDKRLGAVMNFGMELFAKGFVRVANGMPK